MVLDYLVHTIDHNGRILAVRACVSGVKCVCKYSSNRTVFISDHSSDNGEDGLCIM